MPMATIGFLARSAVERHVVIAGAVAEAMAAAVEGEQRHEQDVGIDLRARRASARGCPRRRTRAARRTPSARMISGWPLPATTGSASFAPASASLRISGSGLISLLSGMNPDTTAPGGTATGNGRAGDGLGGLLAFRRRQRVAARDRLAAQDCACRTDRSHGPWSGIECSRFILSRWPGQARP